MQRIEKGFEKIRYRIKKSRNTIGINDLKKASVKEDSKLTEQWNQKLKDFKEYRKQKKKLNVEEEIRKAREKYSTTLSNH